MVARPRLSDSLMADLEALKEPGDAGVEDVIFRLIRENQRALHELERLEREREREQLRRAFQSEWLGRFEDVPGADLEFLAAGDWVGGATGPASSRSGEGQRARRIIADHGLKGEDLRVDRSELRRLHIPMDEFSIGFDDIVDGARRELDRRQRQQPDRRARRGVFAQLLDVVAPTDR